MITRVYHIQFWGTMTRIYNKPFWGTSSNSCELSLCLGFRLRRVYQDKKAWRRALLRIEGNCWVFSTVSYYAWEKVDSLCIITQCNVIFYQIVVSVVWFPYKLLMLICCVFQFQRRNRIYKEEQRKIRAAARKGQEDGVVSEHR